MMKRITGIWEQLPDHGEKPVVIKNCERAEQEVLRLQMELKTALTLQQQCLKLAVAHLGDNWTRQEIGTALFPHSLDLAELL